MQNRNNNDNDNEMVNEEYINHHLKGLFKVTTAQGGRWYSNHENRLKFEVLDKWCWDDPCTPKSGEIQQKLRQALRKREFTEFETLSRELNELERWNLGSDIVWDWFVLCKRIDQFRFVLDFFSIRSSAFIPHDNSLLLLVLHHSRLKDADKVTIIQDLLEFLQIPVILDDELLSTLTQFNAVIPQHIKDRIIEVGEQYKFAHRLATAYAFDDKDLFRRLVDSQPDGLKHLPARYPRFLSTAITHGFKSWVEFMLTFERPTIADYYQVFELSRPETPLRRTLLEARDKTQETDCRITMIVGECPRMPTDWNSVKLEVLRDIPWRSELVVEVNLSVPMFDLIDPLPDYEGFLED